jgi:hypothetical protein
LSKEVADEFVEEALVAVHTEDCDVGNVAVPRTLSGHEGLREFWTGYRNTFGEVKSEFRNVVADDAGFVALEWITEGTSNANLSPTTA